MYLKGTKYTEEAEKVAVKAAFPVVEVKAKIKALVPENGKKLYKEIVDAIEQDFVARNIHLKTDEILNCVKEIDEEWHTDKKQEVVSEI